MRLDKDGHEAGYWCDPCGACEAKMSDEWLERAAEEIKAHRWTSPLDGDDKPMDVLAILKKHRDGKA